MKEIGDEFFMVQKLRQPKGTPIKVGYTYNKDKTLDIEVIDVETNNMKEGKVVLAGSMTDEEKKASQEYIAGMKQE